MAASRTITSTASGATRAFTLTELAIVLGIIGLILGAIWVAASKVYQSNRVDTAVKEAAAISSSYRSLYNTHGVDTGDGTDITCTGVNSGFFPTDMLLPNTTCAGGNPATYPQHPWNSYVLITSYQTTWQGFAVAFYNLPQTACNSLAQQLFSAPDVEYNDINGSTRSLPPVSTQVPFVSSEIAALCAANNSNYIRVIYKGR